MEAAKGKNTMERIEDCISFLLGKAYQQVNQIAKRRMAPYGVTPVQYALLHVLWEQDGQSGADLGARLRLDAATMTGILDRLVHGGLIERRPHPTDRRIHCVFLTEAGRALQAPLDREADLVNSESLRRFSAEEAGRLSDMLAVLGSADVQG
jgi:MarR family transcriptional regulator, organic hydroperoxide resistance regulator